MNLHSVEYESSADFFITNGETNVWYFKYVQVDVQVSPPYEGTRTDSRDRIKLCFHREGCDRTRKVGATGKQETYTTEPPRNIDTRLQVVFWQQHHIEQQPNPEKTPAEKGPH